MTPWSLALSRPERLFGIRPTYIKADGYYMDRVLMVAKFLDQAERSNTSAYVVNVEVGGLERQKQIVEGNRKRYAVTLTTY